MMALLPLLAIFSLCLVATECRAHAAVQPSQARTGEQTQATAAAAKGPIRRSKRGRQGARYVIGRLTGGCSATLISPSHLLTSAHCLHDGHKLKMNAAHLKVIHTSLNSL